MRVEDLQSIRIKLASPEDILAWSHGEVTNPETINYRTQRAEKDGLFDEKIFGPEKDYECYCGKYKRIRYKGIICDRCGVEVTKSQVRRERMGHIKLATPCSHIWFLRGVPSRMGMVLDIPMQQLEKVIYFAAYIITKVNEEARLKTLEEIDREYKARIKSKKHEEKKKDEDSFLDIDKANEGIKASRDKAKNEISTLKPLRILSEVEYHDLSLKYGEVFEAGTGSETLRKIFERVDIKKEIAEFKKQFEETTPVNRIKVLRKLKTLQGMQRSGVRPEWMFLTVLPVLPPDLRPMVQLDGGRYASSDLNDLYRRVINRNNRLKYLQEISAPDVIVRNEKRMLQEAVDALIDNGMRKGTMTQATTGGKRLLKSLADILKGKQGRFRQNLLGKRVDYSGRSVIVVGPKLKISQCGLPKKMALELFKPFVVKKILERELAYNVRGASRLIEEETDDVWAMLEEVVQDKYVLLNRAPTLHRLGIQAFAPILIEGESLKINPLVCKAFNADFDGDQMAVHLPLSDEAQKEAKEIMLSSINLLKPATGTPIVSPTRDIILGCFWLTKIKISTPENPTKGEGKIFGTPEEAILAYEYEDLDLRARIKVRMPNPSKADLKKTDKLTESPVSNYLETSVGRIIFNKALPKDFPYQNTDINSKRLELVVGEVIENYDNATAQETLDKLTEVGFEYSTISGITWGMNDLVVPAEKGGIVKAAEQEEETINSHYKKGLLSMEEKRNKIIEIWTRVKSDIEKLVPKTLSDENSVSLIVNSGSRGSWSQPVQMAGMKGLVINPSGQVIELPVKSCFKEGLNVLEYFISTHGARKGTADTALRTSTAGYLTRRLVDVAHEVIVSEEDCGDDSGMILNRNDADELGQNFIFKVIGRIALEDIKSPKTDEGEGKETTIVKKGEVIDWKAAEKIINLKVNQIRARSPMNCKSIRGVCQKCYGWDLGFNKLVKIGEAVGIVAAQAIGEPGTQLTMRTFHTGGVAGGGDITVGLPRVQEIFEARSPRGKAEISQVDGIVQEITQEGIIKMKANPKPKTSSPAVLKTKNREQKKAEKGDVVEYQIPARRAVWVKVGQEVKKGQQLWEGNVDPKELFKFAGPDETKRYVVKEIQRIYVSQGAIIHDKHIEVIIRQMFSRVKVKDIGDTNFTPGEIMERSKFLEENRHLKEGKKAPGKAVAILLGISRVALTTDSFLSAASFQETSRVLIQASLEGKEDKLRGLKENVIIGKLIPAGTGFRIAE